MCRMAQVSYLNVVRVFFFIIMFTTHEVGSAVAEVLEEL